ncbi:XRE family transcriptional regulator [Burkholderia glumae]|uniref:XRE family transcriptional regulator n=1 Tax=Burkholderia glumae TaxID=337 RepID=UPI002150A7F0|nr:S24/S26 family peptidase [Burkholderia glumae]
MLVSTYTNPYVLRMSNEANFLARNLQWLLDRHGLNPNSLAERLANKPPQATIFRIINGESLTPRDSTVQPLADHFSVPVHELRYVDLQAAHENRSSSRANESDLPNPTDDEFSMVPQLDIAASCGAGKYVDHVVVKGGLAFKRSSLRDFGVPESAARIIYAAGGSMWPTIQDGCVVLLNTADRTPREGRVFAICTPDGGLVLKRLIWDYHPSMGTQTWIMRSDNPDKNAHPDKMLPPDDRTMIIGRAVWNDNRL